MSIDMSSTFFSAITSTVFYDRNFIISHQSIIDVSKQVNASAIYNAEMTNGAMMLCKNESIETHDETYDAFYATAQFFTGLILYPCICIPGLMGNFLTLLVFSKRHMRSSTNAFLSALAVADSIKLLNDLLYFLTILLLRADEVIGNHVYGYLYPYAHFIFSLSVCVSSWLTVSVAVERYVMVCHPTRARRMCTRERAVSVCCAVFLVMTLLALPSALRWVKCIDHNCVTCCIAFIDWILINEPGFLIHMSWLWIPWHKDPVEVSDCNIDTSRASIINCSGFISTQWLFEWQN